MKINIGLLCLVAACVGCTTPHQELIYRHSHRVPAQSALAGNQPNRQLHRGQQKPINPQQQTKGPVADESIAQQRRHIDDSATNIVQQRRHLDDTETDAVDQSSEKPYPLLQ